MDFLADILMASAALSCAAYCVVLSRRLQKLSTLDGQVGGAIALLSKQVDDLSAALAKAQNGAGRAGTALIEQNKRADQAIRKLELLLASLHDLPETPTAAPGPRMEKATPWPRASFAARDDADAPPARRRLVRRTRTAGDDA